MNSQVCVHCLNKKDINQTTNRLVTESCGHVKCMDCLLNEKSGCVACSQGTAVQGNDLEVEDPEPADRPASPITPASLPSDAEQVKFDIPPKNSILSSDTEKTEEYELIEKKKKKPETPHILIETDANGSKYYYCKPCKKPFHARSQVAYHAYCNGQQKPYQCPECKDKSFSSQSHFKYHMRVHRNERTYACDLCGAAFFQMSKLQRHKLKHTKERKYACSECDKSFTNGSSLRKHSLTHSEARPYYCADCDRGFRDQSNFRKHRAKHQGLVCDKKCVGACSHVPVRRAGGAGAPGAGGAGAGGAERAHRCPRCPQAFHSRKDMRRHAAVHTDSKPYRCKVCSRRFRRKDNLERHIRNTHPTFVPAAAVDCDQEELSHIATPEEPFQEDTIKTLNPLPPLPPEVIKKHIHEPPEQVDKSLSDQIIEANNARQSVIFGPVKLKRPPSPKEIEYVHKIKKPIITSCKEVPLPPVSKEKMEMLDKLDLQNNLGVGAPPVKFRELYKKILYERPEKETTPTPTVHWRKLKLNIN